MATQPQFQIDEQPELIKEAMSGTLTGNQSRYDPLVHPDIELSSTDIPKFTKGDKIISNLFKKIDQNELITAPIQAQPETMQFFNKVFENIVETNDVGQLDGQKWETWNGETKNEVTIERDYKGLEVSDKYMAPMDVYVGGPATCFGAALQANSGENAKNILYAHDGCRGTSNWKGSASYHHVHDAIPVYYWPNNHGIYSAYVTAKHHFQRKFNLEGYKKELSTIPQWCKIRWNLGNTLFTKDAWKNIKLFAKNQKEALGDVGLFIEGTQWRKDEDTTAYTTIRHSGMSEKIVEQLKGLEKPVLITNDDRAKCTYVQLGSKQGLAWINSTLKRLDRVGGDAVEFFKNSKEEIESRGYPSDFVVQQLEFTQHGYFPPYAPNALENLVKTKGGKVRDDMRLEKLFVMPSNQDYDDVTVNKAQFRNLTTGQAEIVPVKSISMSLGPSMKSLSVDGKNLLNHTMYASGASTVFMVKVDESKVDESQMLKFRDNIDMKNNHIVRLGERVVKDADSGKTYRIFVLQVTGGGHFPARHAHAEAAINTFKACTCQLFKLDGPDATEGIEYEVVQVRSCARSVGSQNVFRLNLPATNAAMLYGIGGIGITTMAPNALLMRAALTERAKLGNPQLEYKPEEYKNNLSQGQFAQIPYWNKENPFTGRNYARWVDHVNQPKQVAPILYPSAPKLPQFAYSKQYSMASQMARLFSKYKPYVAKLI